MKMFKSIMKSKVISKDGAFGSVADILFDDRSWRVRYFVVDTGGWLPGKKVLLSPQSLATVAREGADWCDGGEIFFSLTKSQIENAPLLEENLPVSRQFEERLSRHYGIQSYWMSPMAVPNGLYPAETLSSAGSHHIVVNSDWDVLIRQRESNFDGHLRSLKELSGYEISQKKERVLVKLQMRLFLGQTCSLET